MTPDLNLPAWEVSSSRPAAMSEEAYLHWLEEERAQLIATGQLQRLISDPARCPVDARFVIKPENER